MRLEGVPPLSENSAPEADAPDSATAGAAKKERVATLRAFKPKEVVELIKRHLGLAVKYAKMTENEKLSDLLKEQAEKKLEDLQSQNKKMKEEIEEQKESLSIAKELREFHKKHFEEQMKKKISMC